MTVPTCHHCGAPLPHPSVRAVLPDALLELPEDRWDAGDSDPGRADFMVADIDGGRHYYLRAIIDLDPNANVCVWVELDPDSFFAVGRAWRDPDRYLACRIEGVVANSVPPWGDEALGARVTLRPKAADKLPVVVATSSPLLR